MADGEREAGREYVRTWLADEKNRDALISAIQGIKDWKRLAVRAGVDPNYLLKGQWTFSELEPIINGYLQRLGDKNEQEESGDNNELQAALAATLAAVQVGAPDLGDDMAFARDTSRPVRERLEELMRRNRQYHGWTITALAKLCLCTHQAVSKEVKKSEVLQKCMGRQDDH